MDKVLVSILTTVYNREKYLADCIKSVLTSSYQNWEMIIVDDQSEDRSVEIARKFEQKDQRIKVYVNKYNLGDYPNRNLAATYARGKYLKYLDSDDIIYPHGLEVMVNAMEQFPKAAFAMPGVPNDNKPFPIYCLGASGIKKHFINGNHFVFGPSALIFRREAFDEIGGFGDNPYVGSDTEVLIRLANNNNYLLIQPSLIWWRTHEFQEINFGSKNFEYYLQGYSRNRTLIEECEDNLGPKGKKKALRKLQNLYIKQSFNHIRKGNYKPIFKLIKLIT